MYLDSDNKQSFLEKVDIFGIGIAIRFSHLPRHNTRFGGLITISILAIILFQLIQTLVGIITFSSPQVIQSDDYVFEPEPFQITPQTFNIAMGLQDKSFNQFYNEKIYSVKATQQTLKKVFNSTSSQYDSIWDYETLNLQTCSKNNFQIQEIQNYFMGISFPLMYCFDTKEDRASIQGEFSANIYKAIEIDFTECVDENYCASAEEKAEYLTNPTLGLFFSNKIVQIQNKNNPFNSVGKNLYWLSGPSIQKYITLNLMNTYINSDFSLFGESKETQRIVQFSSSQEQVVPRSDPVMFRLLIVYEKNREMNYYRKYLKVDQAFSQIGGMFNLLLAAGFLICKPISQLELNRKLLNSIFNISDGNNKDDQANIQNLKGKENSKIQSFEDQKDKERNLVLYRSDSNISKSLHIRKKSKNLPQTNTIISQKNLIRDQNNEASCYIRSFFNIKFSELQIYIKDYLLYYLSCFKCFQTTKQKLIKFGTNKLYSYLDVHYLINKMIEIEKLKHLLLNENQIKLFEYLPRPVLKIHEIDNDKEYPSKNVQANLVKQHTLEIQEQIKEFNPKNKIQQTKKEEVKFCYFDNEEKTQLEKAYDAQKAFNIIMNEQKKSKLDEKLIRMLDTKLINLFADNSFEVNSAKETEDLNKQSENKDFENLNTSILTRDKKKSIFNQNQNKYRYNKEEQQKFDQFSETQELQFQKLNRFRSYLENCDEQEEEEQQQCQKQNEPKIDDLQVNKANKINIPYHQELSYKINQKQLDDD
ncbi:hypothetical protein ABPG74_019418 [Tetrahymena malaccensis]